jgi:amino acid transporter
MIQSIIMKKLNSLQLVLFAVSGIIGSGWLFSPYYGLQIAHGGVFISWFIAATLSACIGLCFAEVSSALPLDGGMVRLFSITHNKQLGFIFLTIGWVSYLVYLPIESQAAVQYLGFWFPNLITHKAYGVCLSSFGLMLTIFIMLGLTMLNTLHINKVSKISAIVTIWKLSIPILLSILVISTHGSFENLRNYFVNNPIKLEPSLLAICNGGLAFAYIGFQNCIVIAKNADNRKFTIPISLFGSIAICFVIYSLLSLMFVVSNSHIMETHNHIAPLLGLVSLLGMHYFYSILFIDAVLAPLGAATVYTAITSRVLFGLGLEFLSNSILSKTNEQQVPTFCLWINFLIGICFLMPSPSWSQLVNFLSSLTILSCLSGPVSLIMLRKIAPELKRPFKIKYYIFWGYLGFISCSLLVYWSGVKNLFYLILIVLFCSLFYVQMFDKKREYLVTIFKNSGVLSLYITSLFSISLVKYLSWVPFPYDNLLVILLSIVSCYSFTKTGNKVLNQNVNL